MLLTNSDFELYQTSYCTVACFSTCFVKCVWNARFAVVLFHGTFGQVRGGFTC